MDDLSPLVAGLAAFTAVVIFTVGWAIWRMHRAGTANLHPAAPALLLVLALALLTVWILRGEWMGIVSSALLATSSVISLHTALGRRASG
jgi:hypothetical protein